MGIFKKIFSWRHKKKRDEFVTMPYVQAQTLPLPPSTKDIDAANSRQTLTLPLPPSKRDTDAAFSRLLRSSSAHFNEFSPTDYSMLPPIPYSTTKSSLSPSRSPSIMTKSSYTVTVHKKIKLSQTEFPNANPRLDKANSSLESNERSLLYYDHKSTPNLHQPKKHRAPTRRRQCSDPRKVPFTPRDTNRLTRLKQDPSVVSLLNMYDEKGCLDANAFSNTPQVKRQQRESTFKELLALSEHSDGAGKDSESEGGEGDFSWAERFIAESNQSSSTLSTISSPPIQTPTIPHQMDSCKEADTSLSTNESGGLPAISSLEVELSNTETPVKPSPLIINDKEPSALEQGIARTPSKRASQVFNFITEKRERKKSQAAQDMFTTPSNVDKLPTKVFGKSDSDTKEPPIVPTIFVDEYKTNSTIDPDATNYSIPSHPLSSSELAALQLPMPTPISPFVIRGLPQPARSKSRSTGAADVLRFQQHLDERDVNYQRSKAASRNSIAPPERPTRSARRSTGALVVLAGERDRLQEHYRHRESDKERMGLVRGPRPLPTTPASGGKRASSIPIRSAFAELKNGLQDARGAPERPNSGDARMVRSKVYKSREQHKTGSLRSNSSDSGSGIGYISHPRKLGSISRAIGEAALGISKDESGRSSARSSLSLGAASELARSSTTSRVETSSRPASAFVLNVTPSTPVRSRSLVEAPSPASSSELSPEAKQLMADLRTKRMRARYANSQRDAEQQKHQHQTQPRGGRPNPSYR